nr:hypothetical protein CFP56_56837 [Quercus suber]
MKYLEVDGAGRPEAKGRCRWDSGSTSRQGRPIRSSIQCVLPLWSSSLRPDLAISFFDPTICWFWRSGAQYIGFMG